MRIENSFTATMASSFTQSEESFTSDSNYYTYNKSTNRISNQVDFEHPFNLKNNNKNKEYGVNSTIRENDAGYIINRIK
jgi:hypothetical protein